MWQTGPGYGYEHHMQRAAVFNMPMVTRINRDYPIGPILGYIGFADGVSQVPVSIVDFALLFVGWFTGRLVRMGDW